MRNQSRLSQKYIDAYWAEVEGILIDKYKAPQPKSRAAVIEFRKRFGKRGGITLYNSNPAEIALTIAEQELA